MAISSTAREANNSSTISTPTPLSTSWNNADKSIRSPPKAKSVMPNCAAISGLSMLAAKSSNDNEAI